MRIGHSPDHQVADERHEGHCDDEDASRQSTSCSDASSNCAGKETDHPEAPSGLNECAAQRPHDGDSEAQALDASITSAKAPPDLLTGRSVEACLCRELPTDHEAHDRSSGSRCRRARAQLQSSAQELK